MALQLEKELENGTVGNYWSISTIKVEEGRSKVHLTLHVSHEAKVAGKTPLLEISKVVIHTKEQVMASNIYVLMYSELKKSVIIDEIETNEFVNSVDI